MKTNFREFIYQNYREVIRNCGDEDWVETLEAQMDQLNKELYFKLKIRSMNEIINRLMS